MDKLELLKNHCSGVKQRMLKKFFESEIPHRYTLLFSWSSNKDISFRTFKFFVKNLKANSDLSDVVLTLSPDKEMHNKHFKHVFDTKMNDQPE
jgi:hypothetical protein